MKYDLILSIIYYACGCLYLIFAAIVLFPKVKNSITRLFLMLISTLAIWSFSYSISNSAPTAEVSTFCRTFSAFGWGSFSSIFLHFVLLLTKTKRLLSKRTRLIILYLPAIINIILFGPFGCLVEKQYNMVQTDFGWVNMAPMYFGKIWLNAYYTIFSLVSIVLLTYWWKNIGSNISARRELKHFIVSVVVLFFIEAAIDMLPDIFGKKFFPQLPVIFLLVPMIMLFRVLKKTRLIESSKKTNLLQKVSKDLTEDRTRLFKTAASVFTLGGVLSFFMGYFGMKRALEYEFSLAAALILSGIIIGFIPLITRNIKIQNSIFLVVCTLGFFYLMIKDVDTGGLTTWAVYLLFFLFTVILDSKIHAIILTVIGIVTQLLFWKINPQITVIIDINEYITRIFIILLSFYAVQYLTNEYALKIQGYQRFALEQEVLEKISSSFISINTENAHKKIDEMFEMAVEILGFNHAFFIELGTDCKEATVLNMYVDDSKRRSFPCYPGMKFNMENLPLFKSLVEQKTPIMCEDTTNISFEQAGWQSDYFISRGIKSFYVTPIIIDDQLDGIFIIEYKDWIDKSLSDSRIKSLRIIANILGDARKKILYENKLYNFAYFDETTKLANRNMLKNRLDQIISNRKKPEKIGIINIELENLRIINDTFGRNIGEQVIIKSATILEKLVMECGDIARTGEGDFVIILPKLESNEQINDYVNELLTSFSHPVLTDSRIEALFVFVNLGISVYPDDGRDADTLLKNADLARLEANNSNEKVIFYTEQLESHVTKNILLTNGLSKALKNEEFFLEFQPQISCNTGKTVGIEALLRWTNEDNKIVPPTKFIPILEQTGLIYDVGLWVLEHALLEHNKLISKGFPPIRISINLSVVQFQNVNLISDFAKIIKENSVNPELIELEITESLFLENPEDIIEKLHKLKGLGVKIAIDDFGKGYSSLNRLNFVPFDRIKIDKDIIDYIDTKRYNAPITEIIILLSKAFKADVTAEGVETKEQADFLRSIACDEIQGYYFSRPLSSAALEEFLKNERCKHSLTN